MHAIDVQIHARKLFESYGSKAVVEAAQRAARLEKQGDKRQAQTWRRIEAALLHMRGPHVS